MQIAGSNCDLSQLSTHQMIFLCISNLLIVDALNPLKKGMVTYPSVLLKPW